ncbi:MAG: prepilin-type N-terminal cleavage/methylation domain-containing protein [Bacillota bacterium]|nr:prepilin-type N-terminal cleavage/methylation domain-containing protein [Bacillota bacterium]
MVKNQKGVTLIELLAAIALLSVVLLVANSIHLFGQKQMSDQTAEIQNQSNVRLAMDIITKRIRKASTISVDNNGVLTLDNTDVYKLDNNNLTQNSQPIINNLQKFEIQYDGSKITVTIADLPNTNTPQTTLSTTIYIRK